MWALFDRNSGIGKTYFSQMNCLTGVIKIPPHHDLWE